MPFSMRTPSCDPARIKGMSERLIVSRYENNYGGAVKRPTAIAQQLGELDLAKTPVFVVNGLKREQTGVIATTTLLAPALPVPGRRRRGPAARCAGEGYSARSRA
jgi:Fe-Mn family superoxide dismutase